MADYETMTQFKRFDPKTFLESQRQTATSKSETITLATLATLAGPPERFEILKPVFSSSTTSVENENQRCTPAKAAKVAKVSCDGPFTEALSALERGCPDYVERERWQQCVENGKRFLAAWDKPAQALGWTAGELFGLHQPPADPHPSYNRLSRYDETGLVWLLQGKGVVAMSSNTAAIRHKTGAVTSYRKINKPALGPLGDSLEDFR
jgi:hypothetical protein